jgi:hypothetical protein
VHGICLVAPLRSAASCPSHTRCRSRALQSTEEAGSQWSRRSKARWVTYKGFQVARHPQRWDLWQRNAFAGRGDVLEWLAQCPELPSNVRVVVSSRPDYQLLHRFRLAQVPRLREVPIEPDSTEVRADLAQYVARLLAEPLFDGLPDLRREGRTGLANRVVDRARGSLLYLV